MTTNQRSNEMTMEEAKDKMLTESVQYKNGLRTVALRKINNFIDQLFNDPLFNDHEALQQPKSCAKCKAFKLDDEHNDGFGQCFFGIHFPNGNSLSYHKGTDFYCSEFEAKEQ